MSRLRGHVDGRGSDLTDPRPPAEVVAHYDTRFDEDARIRSGPGRLEFLRAQEVVRSVLPAGPLDVADVGGATGVHAEWLLTDGHRVHLVDPVPSHVDAARASLGARPGFEASVGDARAVPIADHSVDAVLLFGPLYHLVERDHRVAAWNEARRIVRGDGVVLGALISRFASLFDGLRRGRLHDDRFRRIVAKDLETGHHVNPTGDPDWFTTAYLHHPREVGAEVGDAGLQLVAIHGLEGMAAWVSDLAEGWDRSGYADVILDAARATATDEHVLAISPHLLAVCVVDQG